MNDFYLYLFAFGVGAGLGLLYFRGLWWTTQQLPHVRHPILLIIVSFVGRVSLSLVGFYLVANGRWERLFVCALGFFLIQLMLIRYWQIEQTEEKRTWI